MTSISFCKWVNDELLPNNTSEPGFPRQVSVEVCWKWLHKIGFKVKRITKGIYVDDHEREDVVQARDQFFCELTQLGFLNQSNSPSELLFSQMLSSLVSVTIHFFFDESTFSANDDEKNYVEG